jgi:hypothetical protein
VLPKRNYGPHGGPIAFSKTTKMIKNNHYSHSQAELNAQPQPMAKAKLGELTEKAKKKLTVANIAD